MAVYKVIQDVEAEDKLIGPLTLKQFIFAGVAFGSAFIAFLIASKTSALAFIPFLPLIIIPGILAAPFGKDQPTDIWLAAQIRFRIKPRKRIWDQSGIKNLVTITAPKKSEKQYTDGLSQQEVQSRLKALAATIDSHGWAVKNEDINLFTSPTYNTAVESDRLVGASSLPQVVPEIDINAADDIMDAQSNTVAQHFDAMVKESTATRRQAAIDRMQTTARANDTSLPNNPNRISPTDQSQLPPDAAMFGTQVVVPRRVNDPKDSFLDENQATMTPNSDEAALLEQIEQSKEQSKKVSHLISPHHKSIKTPEEIAAEEAAQVQAVTPPKNPDIVNLANTDFSVATIAGLANRKSQSNSGEVVVNLH